jgi:hypothetical protein
VHRENYETDLKNCNATLVIVSKYEHTSQSKWVEAVGEIYGILNQHGIRQTIELIDERAFSGPLPTSPVLSTDHALIHGWREGLQEFLLLSSTKTG